MTPTLATNSKSGLTSAEAQARLKQFGPNAVVEEKTHPARQFLERFWAPIPWLLEATIIIQLFLGERVEAAVIGGLLVLNAVLSLLQEGRAQKALALLRQQLHVKARVRREGAWVTLPAEELVPGDVIHLRQGTIVPADVCSKMVRCWWTSRPSPVNRPPCRSRRAGRPMPVPWCAGAKPPVKSRPRRPHVLRQDRRTRPHRPLGQPAGTRNCGRRQKSLCGQRGNGGDRDGVRALRGDVARADSTLAAGRSACLHSRGTARHLHVRRSAGFAGVIQTRRTDHASRRLA